MENKSAAYITSLGIVSAIGNTVSENLSALNNMEMGIKAAAFLSSKHSFPVGEVKLSNIALGEKSGVLNTLPRTALLSILAAKEAIAPFQNNIKGFRTAFIAANTVGGMDLTESAYDDIRNKTLKNPRKVMYHECGSITELTLEALGLDNCWTTTLSTACSSSANAIMLGAKLIEDGKMDIVIAGGADSLSKFTLNGFNALMILDKNLCQPFDENRRGLNLGEGAAYIVMMNEQTAKALQAKKMAILSGYANANDAHHQTASSAEGVGNQLAIRGALSQAGLTVEDIQYINLHGTGTGNNDSSEGIAISNIWDNTKIPAASSTKCYTGHTLGAAGAVEAVFSVLAIQEQKAWAHLRLQNPIADLQWHPNTEIINQPVQHVLSNSFGFGGNCSALVISKV